MEKESIVAHVLGFLPSNMKIQCLKFYFYFWESMKKGRFITCYL
jgi:hypothetical protein